MPGCFCFVSAPACDREPHVRADPGAASLAAQSRSGAARIGSARKRRPIAVIQLQGLVVVQVTLAFVLLIGAGLVITTLVRLQNADLGVDTSGLLSLQVQLPRAQYMKENVGVAPGITLVDYSPSARS